MGHIEQAGALAGVVVFGHQARRVLHRHGVAGKRYHARTQFNVQGVERRCQQWGIGGSGQGLSPGKGAMDYPRQRLFSQLPRAVLPPLSALPERFTGIAAHIQAVRKLRFAPSVDGIRI